MIAYDLDGLGWFLFERLADAVAARELGVEPGDWEGHADEERGAMLPDGRRVVSTFVRAGDDVGAGDVVITNAAGIEPPSLGREELCARLDADPSLRLALPSVLGALDPLARVFVPTRAYARAVAALERHRFCVLTGAPEMGKTAIARMIALARVTDGWEAHEALRPEDVLRAFKSDTPQVFVADDAFGSTEYRPEAAERWAVELASILRRLGETGRHWLIWTSRPAPLHAGLARVHRERGLERFPNPNAVQVDAAALDETEKALILLRHALASELAAEERVALRASGVRAVRHRHFTPERIRRLVAGFPDVSIDAALTRPTEAMTTSFAMLDDEQRALLVAMLDQPPGPVEERDLLATLRRMQPGEHHAPADLVGRLADHFLHVDRSRVSWVHPSWRDLVIEHLATDAVARRRFLHEAGVHGVLLALSTGGGPLGERVLPLLVEDADWDALGDRIGPLARSLPEPDLEALLEGLGEALAAHGHLERAGAELRAVAERLLTLVAGRWAAQPHAVIGLGLLGAWLRLRTAAGAEIAAPDLRVTWAELLPPETEEAHGGVLERTRDWTLLIELLTTHAPSALRDLGYSKRQAKYLGMFAQSQRDLPDVDPEPIVAFAGLDIVDPWRILADLA